MRFAGLAMVLAAIAAGADEVPSTPVSLTMVALKATRENPSSKHFDPGLDEVRKVLEGIEYDTFRKLKRTRLSARYGEESRIAVCERYTLFFAPKSKDASGRIRARVRITLASKTAGKRPLNALETTLVMAPGRAVCLRGLKLDRAELIVVLSVGD